MPLDRAAFLSRSDLARELVDLPELGEGASVWARALTAAERDDFERQHHKDPHQDFRARMAVAAACDEAGVNLFTRADLPALNRMSAAALDRIVEASMRLSKMGESQVQDAVKNS